MTATVKRGDIGITYKQPEGMWLYPPPAWEAQLHGRLSSGEAVTVTCDGRSADEALLVLELKIKHSGWEIEGGWTPVPTGPRKSVEEMHAEMAALRAVIDSLKGQGR